MPGELCHGLTIPRPVASEEVRPVGSAVVVAGSPRVSGWDVEEGMEFTVIAEGVELEYYIRI